MKEILFIAYLILANIYFVKGESDDPTCNYVQNHQLTGRTCSEFDVEVQGKACVRNYINKNSVCIEVFEKKCDQVTTHDLTGKLCSDFAVESDEKKCVSTGNSASPCKEVYPITCNEVKNQDLTGRKCSDFPTADSAKSCYDNDNMSSPCIERGEKKCLEVTHSDLSNQECSKYSTSHFAYQCVTNDKLGEGACKEEYWYDVPCSEITKEDFEDAGKDCSGFKTNSLANVCSYRGSNDHPCGETSIYCKSITSKTLKKAGTCSAYKVESEGWKCVENEDTGGCLELLSQQFLKLGISFIGLLILFLL